MNQLQNAVAQECLNRAKECVEEAKRLLSRPQLSADGCKALADQLNQANNAAQRLVAIVLTS